MNEKTNYPEYGWEELKYPEIGGTWLYQITVDNEVTETMIDYSVIEDLKTLDWLEQNLSLYEILKDVITDLKSEGYPMTINHEIHCRVQLEFLIRVKVLEDNRK